MHVRSDWFFPDKIALNQWEQCGLNTLKSVLKILQSSCGVFTCITLFDKPFIVPTLIREQEW